MRRPRIFPVEDLLLSQFVPGLLLAVLWTVMYEIYNEEGSYYTTLMQEILGTEGLFPYFVVLAVLMAFPVGMLLDTVRHVVGEHWLGIPRIVGRKARGASPLQWLEPLTQFPEDFAERCVLYRHVWATVLTPAKAAGNLALVLLIFSIWFVVKIIRMRGWHVFSLAFIIGTPIAGLGLVIALLVRYTTGLREFDRRVHESIFPPKSMLASEPFNSIPAPPS